LISSVFAGAFIGLVDTTPTVKGDDDPPDVRTEYLNDTFEAVSGFTPTGYWHLVDDLTDPCIGTGPPNPTHPSGSHSPTHSFGYHMDASCDYNDGNPAGTIGRLTSAPIDLSTTTVAWLHFWTYFENEGGTAYDTMWVQMSANDVVYNNEFQVHSGIFPPTTWVLVEINISAYANDPTVWVRFEFDSGDDMWNDYAGWYIDDVLVDDVEPPHDTLTVEWWDRAPLTAEQDSAVLMLQLNLTSDIGGNGQVQVNGIRIDFSGSPPAAADIVLAELWLDVDNDDTFEPLTDLFVNSGAPPFPITLPTGLFVTPTPVKLFVVYYIAPAATVGDWVGVLMPDNTFINVAAPDAVSTANFPIDTYVPATKTLIVANVPDVLTVLGADKAPINVILGDTFVLMLNLTLLASSDFIDVTSVSIDLTGTAVDADISAVTIWDDTNDNGQLDIVFDMFLGAGAFVAGTTNILLGPPIRVWAGTPERLLIAYNFPCAAVVTRTAGALMVDNTYVTVAGSDTVDPATFPISSTNSVIDPAIADTLTLTGTDLAPANVYQGDFYVYMEQLTLTVSTASTLVQTIDVDLSGTGADADIAAVTLVDDLNDNGVYELGFDNVLDTQTFVGGSLTFMLFPPLAVNLGTPENLLILYDIDIAATIGNTVGVELFDNTYVTLDPSTCVDTIAAGPFPIQSANSVIGAPTVDTLTVTGTDLAPATAENNTWALMYQLNLTASANSITVDTITIDLTGASDDLDITVVSLYHDVDNDGSYDVGLDSELQISLFSGGSAQLGVPGNPLITIYAGTAENLLILYGIAPTATIGNTTGLELVDSTYVTVLGGADTINPGPFPLTSSLSTIVAFVPDVINSLWTTSPPTMDGIISPGEWTDATVVDLGLILTNNLQGELLVKNDGTNLYIAMDATGDNTNSEDYSTLWFDTNNDAVTTDGEEDIFVLGNNPFNNPNGQTHLVWNDAAAAWWPPHCTPYDTGLPNHANLAGNWDFGPSPSSATDHRMFEHRIPLALLGASPGSTIGLMSQIMNFDFATFTFIWSYWPMDLPLWPPAKDRLYYFGDLVLATSPAPPDTLTVTGTDLAPATVNQGEPDVEMLGLNLSAGTGSVIVNSIKIDLGGIGTAADIALVEIYDDVNDNQAYDAGTDVLLGSGTFAGMPISVTVTLGGGFTVNTGTDEKLLVVYDIDPAASVGNTVGVFIADNTSVAVAPPDTVASFASISSTNSIIQGPDTLTVTGTDLAPVDVYQGDNNIEMEWLTLNTATGSVTVNSIQIDLSGTGVAADIANVKIYDDVNDNQLYDAGTDALLGQGTFAGIPPTVTITIAGGFDVTAGTPEHLLVAYDIDAAATVGNTVGVSIIDNTYVTVTAPDTVAPFGPIASTNSNILLAVPDSLTVTGTDMAPATVNPGNADIEMEYLTLSAGSGIITVNSITIDSGGTGADADVANVEIYDDTNDNQAYDVGTDALLGQDVFAAGTVTIALGGGFSVTSGTDENLLVVYDIDAGATIGNTVGVSIADNTYITVSAPDTVAVFAAIASTNSLIQAPVFTGDIAGTIEDKNDDPIQGVSVTLTNSTDAEIGTDTTDSDGNYSFSGVDEGTDEYTITVSKTGYKDKSASDIDVTAGVTTYQNFTLTTNATISGQVVDANGDPIEGATVELLDDDGNVENTDTTDADGNYKFTGVDYGDYKLKISADGYDSKTTDISFTVDKDNLDVTRPDVALAETAAPAGLGDWWWIIIIIVIVVVVVLIVVLMMMKKKKKAAAEAVPPEAPPMPPPEAPMEMPPETPPAAPEEMPPPPPPPPPAP